MTENDLKNLLDSCKPTPVMRIGGCTGPSQQENANRAWRELGKKYGFDYMTVRPVQGKGQRFFTAVPTENETQKKERLEKESEAKRLYEIESIKNQIVSLQNRLKEIE